MLDIICMVPAPFQQLKDCCVGNIKTCGIKVILNKLQIIFSYDRTQVHQFNALEKWAGWIAKHGFHHVFIASGKNKGYLRIFLYNGSQQIFNPAFRVFQHLLKFIQYDCKLFSHRIEKCQQLAQPYGEIIFG